VYSISALVGDICTGIFAVDSIAYLDNSEIVLGSWLNHHWVQLAYQITQSLAEGLYSFCRTYVILFVINIIPGLRLRVSEESKVLGLDDVEVSEFVYNYAKLTRELLNDIENKAQLVQELEIILPLSRSDSTDISLLDI
jgi:ammonium transporter, Amt family